MGSEEFVQVSHVDSKKIIGKAGSNITKIEQSTWAKIEIDKSEGDYRMVRVSGSPEAVDQALSMIQETIGGAGWQKHSQKWRSWSKDWDHSQKRKWNSNDWQDWGGK